MLSELRIKIDLEKYSNFASKVAKGHLVSPNNNSIVDELFYTLALIR